MNASLGITVITYNRVNILRETIRLIRELTTGNFELIISDDGSTDGTVEFCRSAGIRFITAPNGGIAMNKNRGLYALMQYTQADTFLILEDDCQPALRGWNEHWQAITRRWHHVCYGPVDTWPAEVIKSGHGTIEDPYRLSQLTAQITGVTREAVNRVGYLSPRFSGYGHEHVEWTRRFARAGYFRFDEYPCSNYGLFLAESGSFFNAEEVEKNHRILLRIDGKARKPVKPWRTFWEKRRFIRVIRENLAREA